VATRVENFLHCEVLKYLMPDIQRLTTLRPQGLEGLGACAIPEAMLLFALTDLFGFLVRTDCKKPKIEDTKRNLKAIFVHELGKFPAEYKAKSDTLAGLYRHGLMHQVFPKAAGIRKAGPNKALFHRFDYLDHLNVDRFAMDVIRMLESFTSEIPLPEWRSLRDEMSYRLDQMSDSNFRAMTSKRQAEHQSGA